MKKFLLKLSLLLTPVLAVLVLYVVLDPFKVLRTYDDYYENGNMLIWPNHSMVDVESYTRSTSELGMTFDSFLFGDSRSTNFRAAEWEKYLPEGSRAFHFDGYNDAIVSVVEKVKYLDRHGVRIKNAIFPIDIIMAPRSIPNYGYRFMLPPSLGANPVTFHIENLRTYLSPQFLTSYLARRLFGTEQAPPKTEAEYHEWLATPGVVTYNPVINELTETRSERLIAEGKYFPPNLVDSVMEIRSRGYFYDPLLTEDGVGLLKEMAEVFRRHQTDYRIIIIPRADSITLPEADEAKLKEIFDPERVVRLDTLSCHPTLFYDRLHITNRLANDILRRVYRPQDK